MRTKNICKFVTNTTTDNIDIKQFIYESDSETMKTPRIMHHNTATLITDGSGTVVIDGRHFDVKKGSFFFAFSQEVFCVETEDKLRYLYVAFDGSRADALFRRFGIDKENRCFLGFDGMIPMWFDSLSGASETNVDLAAESVLLYGFSRLEKSASKNSNLINSIYEITESDFTSPELSVSYIADRLSYNPKYISHFFKNHTGVSYSEYLRTLRIKYAVSLFEHGIDSVKNVAFLCGFSDPLYFSTVFKKIVGMSPTEYKNKANSECDF